MKTRLISALALAFAPLPVFAATGSLDLTQTVTGFLALALFALAYLLVMGEEQLHLRKSKPVLVASGIIWALIAWHYTRAGMPDETAEAFRHTLLEFSELMLFLLVAMTYINAMEERRVFDALRAWLIKKGFSYPALFWITGLLSFFLSPVADNLTTALLMCAVVMKVAAGNSKFIAASCVNIVMAANAGGAFSPFGDITTLMVWQAGVVQFQEFFALLLPAAVSYLVPAVVIYKFIPKEMPGGLLEDVELKRGAIRICCLFLATIATAVIFKTFLHMPPVMGMMMGLGYLQFFGYFLRMSLPGSLARKRALAERTGDEQALRRLGGIVPFDVFSRVQRAEWDTLLFFYGVVMCVGGLGYIGYLSIASDFLYLQWNPTVANIVLGMVSAVIDNIPVMFAVLTMQPEMSHGQWLLITLTAGIGGSLLSVGSAAGVALMGQARGHYTFFSHLKWSPVILLGYFAGIGVHFLINQRYFDMLY